MKYLVIVAAIIIAYFSWVKFIQIPRYRANLALRDFYKFMAGDAAALKSLIGHSYSGDKNIQCMIGMCYDIMEDFGNAISWFQKAAQQGSPEAQRYLGIYYIYGKGVPINLATAVEFIRNAAYLTDKEAQGILSNLYMNGLGVPKNKVAAYAISLLANAVSTEQYKNAKDDYASFGLSNRNEISSAVILANSMSIPYNFLKALDKHIANHSS